MAPDHTTLRAMRSREVYEPRISLSMVPSHLLAWSLFMPRLIFNDFVTPSLKITIALWLKRHPPPYQQSPTRLCSLYARIYFFVCGGSAGRWWANLTYWLGVELEPRAQCMVSCNKLHSVKWFDCVAQSCCLGTMSFLPLELLSGRVRSPRPGNNNTRIFKIIMSLRLRII